MNKKENEEIKELMMSIEHANIIARYISENISYGEGKPLMQILENCTPVNKEVLIKKIIKEMGVTPKQFEKYYEEANPKKDNDE